MKTFFFSLLILFSIPLCATQTIEERVNEIFGLLSAAQDQGYIGESVSQLEHALQCAHLATLSGADDDVIIAALFHDIGHLLADAKHQTMGNFGIAHHEIVGSDYLASLGFSRNVCSLIEGHVEAKRYKTFKDEEYFDTLSPASKFTLEKQGGRMTIVEASEFEHDPLFRQKLMIRTWDDQAKVPEILVPSLEKYRFMVIQHLNQQSGSCNQAIDDSI